MSQEVKLPQLGEGVAGGDIVNVLIKEGDLVEKDQPLFEIETDKAVAEIPTPFAGRITKIFVKTGDNAKVGNVLCVVEENNSAKTSSSAKPIASSSSSSTLSAPLPQKSVPVSVQEVKLPELGEGVVGGDIVNVAVKEGDKIQKEQTLFEVETEKAVAEVPAPFTGKIINVLVKTGDKAKVGDVLCRVEVSDTESPKPISPVSSTPTPSRPNSSPVPVQSTPPSVVVSDSKIVPATPHTRRFSRELGIDISKVSGTGPGGRITVEDVKSHARTELQKGAGSSVTSISTSPLPDFSQWGPVEKKPLSNLRRKISEQMSLSWTIPMVTQYDEADITELEALRKKLAPKIKEKGGVLTVTSFALKVVTEVLKKFPQCNASLDLTANSIIYKNYFHIGVAVDTDAGLIVPVIRDVDKKNLQQLSIEVAEMARKARDRKVSIEELRGATFTISNLGGIGGTQFSPLVNPPQAAILGIARAQFKPVWRNNTFEPRLVMPICVSYDHRLIDGADGARFTRQIAQGLEQFDPKQAFIE